jgi:hypothetical protein
MESNDKVHLNTPAEETNEGNLPEQTVEKIAIEPELAEAEGVVSGEIIAETADENELVDEKELVTATEVVAEPEEEIAAEQQVETVEEPEVVVEEEKATEVVAEPEEVVAAEEQVETVEEPEVVVVAEEKIEADDVVSIVAEDEVENNQEIVADTVVEITDEVTSAVEERDEEIDEEIDEELAEELVDEPQSENIPDYSSFSEIELINELRTLLETRSVMQVIDQIESIKINFYKKHKLKIQEAKKNYIDSGGFEEEYSPESDPYEQDIKLLLQQYKQKRFEHNKDIEAEKDGNLQKKFQLIEEIKTLVNRKESINKTFQEFRELQQKWHETGLVPQANMKDLWETYHHHVENFYDYIKINKELRDLDLKRNMEEKINLCEKAEALLLEPSVLKSFNALQKFHDVWREIGPVPRDKKEELWERFKAATTLINKKHQDFFENRKKSQKKNLDAKTALCEKVEEILEQDLSSHTNWEEKSKDLVELQKYWRTIGFAPKKDNTQIYERFRKACDNFFDLKREFYSKHKEEQTNNLQLKIDLCLQAEALKESTDWKKTSDEYISIQKKWKEIGPVPRKQSDIVWKRFRAACDCFFKRKSEFFNTKDSTQGENLKLKNELIDAVVAFESTGDNNKDFEVIRDYQRRWNEIGHVPIQSKEDVQKRFREAINKQFDKLRVGDKDRNLMRFKNKMSDMKSNSRGNNKMFSERDKYIVKLRQLESDLVTLKNNIGFFSNSKNAEALIKDVERKISNNEEQIAYLKDKIRVIDDVEFNKE